MSVSFRTARADELPLVLSWAEAEGWNPGPDDAAAFFASDPEGFFVADADTGPVAAISVVNHSDAFAFLGLYLCLPEHRGKGIGFGLWQHALAHAGARCVGLDGVPAQQDNYRKSSPTPINRRRQLRALAGRHLSTNLRRAAYTTLRLKGNLRSESEQP